MNAEPAWLENFRAAHGIDDAALVLAQAAGETAHAEKCGVFLLDYTRGNLLLTASWSVDAGAKLENKEGLSSYNLEDPLCLALQRGKVLACAMPVNTASFPSLTLMGGNNTATGGTLWAYPLLSWDNMTIGGIILNLATDISASDNAIKILCDYCALLISFFEQQNQDKARIASLHEDVTRMEEVSFRQMEAAVNSLIVGHSRSIRNVCEQIVQIAPHTVSVLITGETGTGKDLAATAIHAASQRNNKPFVKINCGALPPQLLESELFGYKKGAFSGAHSDHTGLLQSAEGGTILLDEIGEMPVKLQVKLLQVLQEHQVRPVGAVRSYPVDIRIVAATNQNIKKAVKAGQFRKDLYYRVASYHIHMPTLRERREDIPYLASYFLEKCKKSHDTVNYTISFEEMLELCQYDYPGNIRELASKIENMLIAKSAANDGNNNHTEDYNTNTNIKLSEYVTTYEKSLIQSAIVCNNGNISKAARALSIPRTTLFAKLNKNNRVKGKHL
ncbi:MAG: sigma-54 dependent transcriptional regulator [Desulfovibrio sp.]|jgi:sigma-54-dependent transcriptional regulator|nr:sigma-54 dependent transcriptional regulator [Desulfovibrio sp.]